MSEWLSVLEFSDRVGKRRAVVERDIKRFKIPKRKERRPHCFQPMTVIHESQVKIYNELREEFDNRSLRLRPELPENHPRILQGKLGLDGKMRYPTDREWKLILKSDKLMRKPLVLTDPERVKLRLIVNKHMQRWAA